MNDLLVERFFSVSVELTDGRSTQLKVRGESPAEVFKDVRARSDVRRVGKVVEIVEDAFHSDKPIAGAAPAPLRKSVASSAPKPQAASSLDHSAGEDHAGPDPRTPREALIGFTISGPRVIRGTKPAAYERPTNHFRAPVRTFNPLPPDSSKPVFSPFGPVKGPVANDPSRPPVFAKPAPAAEAPSPEAEEDPVAETPATREYRIVKSRRQGGEPYLLQRGNWGMVKGKRTFTVEWEKGFESRENAEKQQAWLEQMAKEAAELHDE